MSLESFLRLQMRARDDMAEESSRTGHPSFAATVLLPKSPDHFDGSRLFVADDGMAGFALRTARQQLTSFFVSPRAPPGAAARMTMLAVQVGVRMLLTYDLALPRFFKQFGFVGTARFPFAAWKDAPPDWVPAAHASSQYPDGRPELMYMIYGLTGGSAPAAPPPMSVAIQRALERSRVLRGPQESCGACGQAVPGSARLGVIGGYECPRCAFVDVWGGITAA